MALKRVEKKALFLQTKRRGCSTYQSEVLVYRATIREPTPRVVSILAYHLVAKITSFQIEIQSEMLLIFYFKKFANILI